MTLEQVYFVAEIIAALAIVISLLYLGMQIRNSRIQAKNEAIDLITKERGDFIRLLAENSEISRIIPKGFAGKRMHPNEQFRFNSYIYYVFVNLELAFRKIGKNEIDKSLWRAYDEGTHWWVTGPGVREWWKNDVVRGFTEEFNNYVNAMIEKISADNLNAYDKQTKFMAAAGNKP